MNILDLCTSYTDNPKKLVYENMNSKIETINYWSTESAVAIVIIQIKKSKSLSKKLDNQNISLFNKKCYKYFCDSISIGFIEVHLDVIFDASHTLWPPNEIPRLRISFLHFLFGYHSVWEA